MNFNKSVLIIMFSVSFQTSIISMNESSFVPRTESEKQAFQVAASMNTNFDLLHLRETGIWLSEKRKTVSEKAWPVFVNQFVSDIEKIIPYCSTSLEKTKLEKVKDIIAQAAYKLESGKNCLLLARVLTLLENPQSKPQVHAKL